jgi:integrase/recombinase XerD
LSGLSKAVGMKKKFADMTRDDIVLSFLDRCRKSEDKDPMHKWINTYNTKRLVVIRFFKWLYFPDVGDPKKRAELAANEGPKCIQYIPKLKRKEVSSYKPGDMWTPEEDLLFLKYVSNKRDRCYYAMSRDLSGRPHEILHLKIGDVVLFRTVDTATGKRQYTEVVVNGKTGSRPIPLIQSIPYVKTWLEDHPSKNNPESWLFVSLNTQSNGRKRLDENSLYGVYLNYKKDFFPRLLQDPTISNEDKDKIRALLAKPWNPYVRRHTGATEKSKILNEIKLKQYGGWSANSNQPRVYTHYFGNESSKSLLEVYGIEPKNSSGDSVELLSPKICPNCHEGNTYDAKFCAKCRLVLTYDAYNETLQQQQEKELEIQSLQREYESLKEQVEENKRSQLDLFDVVAGLRKQLGIPADKNIVWDWTKKDQGQISFCDEEEYRSKHKYKGPVRYYHKRG